ILSNSAGMIGPDYLAALGYRNQMEDIPNMNRDHAREMRGDPEFQFEINPDDECFIGTAKTFIEAIKTPERASLYIQELLSVAWIQTAELLRRVKEKGVDVIILAGPEDGNFPVEYMTGTPKKNERGEFVFDEKGKVVMEKRGPLAEQLRPGETDYSNIL